MLKSERFGFWATLTLVFLLLTFKGSIGEGQPTLFSNVIEQSIEETSSSIVSYAHSASQLADISTLAAINQGQGGQDVQDTVMTPLPINDNSLLAHNPISMDYIEIGGSKRSQIVEYTVQEGDLLSFIASDYGVSVNSIIWANNLRSADSLTLGQVLKIPPVSGIIHRVVKGDSVSTVAKKYGAEEAKIIEFNTLPQGGDLTVGDELIVPDGQMRSTSVASAGARATGSSSKPFAYLPNLGDYFIKPTTGYNWGRIHGRNGVDIANSRGTPIYAAAEGTVAIADSVGYNGGFGQYIKIIHPNNTETLYAHGSKLLVSAGEYVGRGQMIMLMGSTGRSTGNHLHFEVHGAKNILSK